jgi:hypothetical protein
MPATLHHGVPEIGAIKTDGLECANNNGLAPPHQPRTAAICGRRNSTASRVAAIRNESREDSMNQVTRLKAGTVAATNETIELNDIETDLEKARFDHQARLFALQQEFNAKRDKLRSEYHARVQEITGEPA